MDERQLAALWRSQRLDLSRLRTTDGHAVEVIYRGRAHKSTGPDFEGAIVVVDGQLRRGDVELHVASSEWTAHRHDRDHRYDRVVLHVVLRDDPGYETRTAAGARIACLPLEGILSPGDTSGDAGPAGACRPRVAAMSDDYLGSRLDALGDRRLAERAAVLAAESADDGFEQCLYARLLDALGYSQNRVPARDLAARLSVERLYALAHRRSPDEVCHLCRALLLGVAGLLPSQRALPAPLDWASEEEAEELEAIWRAFGEEWAGETLAAGDWTLAVRPLNSPQRRLAGLAEILGRYLASGLVTRVLECLQASDPRSAAAGLVSTFTVEAPDSYWAGYHDFGRPVPGMVAPRLVGPERAREVAASVALPLALAWAEGIGDADLAARTRAAFACLPPLATNEPTRWMVEEVIGRDRRRLVASARRQQGLYHLFRIACDQRLCERCPL